MDPQTKLYLTVGLGTMGVLFSLSFLIIVVLCAMLKYRVPLDPFFTDFKSYRNTTQPTDSEFTHVFQINQPPQILYETECELPDYPETSRSASPLPSYEDVVYCDQVNRSFQNLLSVV